jgi:hypothetical protein
MNRLYVLMNWFVSWVNWFVKRMNPFMSEMNWFAVLIYRPQTDCQWKQSCQSAHWRRGNNGVARMVRQRLEVRQPSAAPGQPACAAKAAAGCRTPKSRGAFPAGFQKLCDLVSWHLGGKFRSKNW